MDASGVNHGEAPSALDGSVDVIEDDGLDVQIMPADEYTEGAKVSGLPGGSVANAADIMLSAFQIVSVCIVDDEADRATDARSAESTLATTSVGPAVSSAVPDGVVVVGGVVEFAYGGAVDFVMVMMCVVVRTAWSIEPSVAGSDVRAEITLAADVVLDGAVIDGDADNIVMVNGTTVPLTVTGEILPVQVMAFGMRLPFGHAGFPHTVDAGKTLTRGPAAQMQAVPSMEG